MKKITRQQEGTMFLIGLCSFIWYLIGKNNGIEFIERIISAIVLGAISTIILAVLFAFMKNTFDW